MKRFWISCFTLLILFTPSWHTHAEDSITGDFANKTFSIDLTDGTSIFSSQEDYDKRLTNNNQIIQGIETQNLSLYDRFGGNIRFIPYYGEKKFGFNMADNIYTSIKEGEDGFSISIKDLLTVSDAKVNNVVYEGRPDIISEEEFEAGVIDPRRSAYSVVSDTGGSAAIGNMNLQISIVLNTFFSYFLGNQVYEDSLKLWDYVTDSGLFIVIGDMIESIIPYMVIFFVVYILMSIIRMSKGQVAIGKVIIATISFMFSIGIIFATLVNPNILSPVTNLIIVKTNDLFGALLQVDANEVTKSDDDRYVIEATLWSKSVLDPWSMGMFGGRKYDELYTQYASVQSTKKMPQTNEDILGSYGDGERRYSSAYLTGDIRVPIGNGKHVRNWAALAWSTQSLYHIDAVEATTEEVEEGSQRGTSTKSWPKAILTPKNNQIYIDNFRWLDAKLDVSPGFDGPEDSDGNYQKSIPYSNAFTKYGIYSLFLTLLMLPMMYPAFMKLLMMVKTIIAGFRWMGLSIMSVVRPGNHEYNHINNLKTVFQPAYLFFWWSIVIYILIYLYTEMVGNSILVDIVWIFLSIIIVKFKPMTNSRQVMRAQRTVKKQFNNISKNVLSKLQK